MTILVGVLCQDGVVIASDSAASNMAGNNFTTGQIPVQKVDIVGNMIVAGTGAVGLDQAFKRIVELHGKALPLGNPNTKPIDAMRLLSGHVWKDFVTTGVQFNAYGALVGFLMNGVPQLCTFDPRNLQPEIMTDQLWYGSLGSGQLLADSFLAFMRSLFPNGRPSLLDGRLIATWTIKHVVDNSAGFVGGEPQIAVMAAGKDAKPTLLSWDDIQESLGRIDSVVEQARAAARGDAKANVGVPSLPQ